MLKGIIFDMDGVISDTEPMHNSITIKILELLKVPYTKELLRTYVGVSYKDLFRDIIWRFNLNQTVDELLYLQVRLSNELFKKEHIPPIQATIRLIRELHSKGYKLAVASSSMHEMIELILTNVGVLDHMDIIISGYDVKESKPNPDIFLLALKKMNLNSDECIVIEDSNHGVLAAHHAGIRSVGYANPNSRQQHLSYATVVVDDIAEVDAQFLENLMAVEQMKST